MEMAVVPTNVAAYMLSDEKLDLIPRSGLGMKYQITIQNSPALIDADFYPRPFMVLVRNEGKEPFQINPGNRIAQAVFTKYLLADGDKPISEDREGGFGHSGI